MLVPARAASGHVPFNDFEKGIVMWKKALFVLMSLLSLALTACNTMEGAGRDVSAAGRSVAEEAREHKNY
jgi:predicted small secreted protein